MKLKKRKKEKRKEKKKKQSKNATVVLAPKNQLAFKIICYSVISFHQNKQYLNRF